MIYVGYPCVGKSSISGIGKNIDLESSNFFYDVNGLGEYQRDSSWAEIYANIAVDLDKQGFDVFVSSHGQVIKELKSHNAKFCGIFPNKHLKNRWIERATKRNEQHNCSKNAKALARIKSHFEEDIEDLKYNCNGKYIEIFNSDYDLNQVLNTIKKSTDVYQYRCCNCCELSITGYCPIGTNIGCVLKDGKVISNIEEFEKKSH